MELTSYWPIHRLACWGLAAAVMFHSGLPLLRAQDSNPASDPATRSAIHLLRTSSQLRRDGSHVLMMRSLRQMDDPALSPIFEHWADSDQPVLQVHGILGLAQCKPQPLLGLDRLTAIDDPAVQAQLVVAAIEGELLSTDQARQLLEESNLDAGVKLLAALYLVDEKQSIDASSLDPIIALPPQDRLTLVPMLAMPGGQWTAEQLLELEHQLHQALAWLIKLQLGQQAAVDKLLGLNQQIREPARDPVLRLLLATVVRNELDQTASWAGRYATDANVDTTAKMLAIQAGLRFGWTDAVQAWQQEYAHSPGLAQRLRLAMMALRAAWWAEADLFTPLIAEEDPLLQSIGRAGVAISTRTGIGEAVGDLTKMNHPLINQWAVAFAKNRCGKDDARIILLGLISDDAVPEQKGQQWLNQVAAATEALCGVDPDGATRLLRPILNSPETDPQLIQGILFGLVRASKEDHPHRVVESLGPFTDPDANQLVLVVAAKSGQALTSQQQRDLKLLVRGGGGMQEALRLQAAWAYLRMTARDQMAIDQILGG